MPTSRRFGGGVADRPFPGLRWEIVYCLAIGGFLVAYAPVLLASAAADRVRRCRGPRA